ncbi:MULTISPECIES: cbb3-type cytochrome c oxidase N-terminal domain-containing protein [unclassified Polaribacter]|uniref:cbb3-type cytochrome c oxidase N-terminal domain-containing protein n=1 Tax=unclassified Polaribacter TaxID=196858 RepID=UPI0011BDE336|nr:MULTISPECIES: cbb3-type cytochrome c oxidase N-terminal domain-containing protein [unclassified Polaribacter]TXD51154.1 c-type cytochrome [Polaribacter sp. IC063]TXD56550.1 c-type cytochrome [Polaribacter sp. IC066]
MKKKIQSSVYVLFVLITFFALVKSFMTYKNPLNFYENPLVWFSLIGFVAVIVLKEVVNFMAIARAKELQNEKDGIIPEAPKDWVKIMLQYFTRTKAMEEEQEIILDHNYDGIRELDNALPPWWVYMFYASIVFAAVYLVRYQIMDGDTPEMEYEKAVASARMELNTYKATAPDLITADNVQLLTDEKDLNRGRAVFNLNCASCHLGDGGGGIGPNLTDQHWILGGGIKNVFTTISNGGRNGKGMIAWNKTLKPADMAKVSSYVLSMQGTTPANGKAPQGEIWVDATVKKEVVQENSKEVEVKRDK